MASATATAKADQRPARGLLRRSKLGRLIVILNLLGLAILIAGALILNELRRGLIQARMEGLVTQGQLIASVIGQAATEGDPQPALDPQKASAILQLVFIPRSQRARLFDAHGRPLYDSYLDSDRVEWRPLPPARRPGGVEFRWRLMDKDATDPKAVARAQKGLSREVGQALRGATIGELRRAQNGRQVVSVSIPIQRVQAVLGVLTVEAEDVDQIVAAQRKALLPFILVAVGVTLISSLLLTWLVARPVMRLSRAADSVRLQQARAISLPDIARRDDELGDLTRSLQAMTQTLSERMDAIEAFAADVAHEIRNPLTSIRSAVETLDLVKDAASRDRLMAILKQDVGRLDRLITDISNASRLDAELSRDQPRALDIGRLLSEIASIYHHSRRGAAPSVEYSGPGSGEPLLVLGREGPLSQVFRNLIDNAFSFSPTGGIVRVSLRRDGRQAVVAVEDEGPGIPPDNLETVFERFYTARPKGQAFGGHSGLGLSIARQIIQAHNGRIWAENRKDAEGRTVGARLMVSLPQTKGDT
jgi:two-component system sensor histidine kinase ChvG